MGREILRGGAWGVIVLGLMLSVVSLIAPQPSERLRIAASADTDGRLSADVAVKAVDKAAGAGASDVIAEARLPSSAPETAIEVGESIVVGPLSTSEDAGAAPSQDQIAAASVEANPVPSKPAAPPGAIVADAAPEPLPGLVIAPPDAVVADAGHAPDPFAPAQAAPVVDSRDHPAILVGTGVEQAPVLPGQDAPFTPPDPTASLASGGPDHGLAPPETGPLRPAAPIAGDAPAELAATGVPTPGVRPGAELPLPDASLAPVEHLTLAEAAGDRAPNAMQPPAAHPVEPILPAPVSPAEPEPSVGLGLAALDAPSAPGAPGPVVPPGSDLPAQAGEAPAGQTVPTLPLVKVAPGLPGTPEAGPAPATRIATGGGSRMPGKKVGRLPSVGSVVPANEPALTPDPAAQAPGGGQGNALVDFARPFDTADTRPRLAILLIDEGMTAPSNLPLPDLPISFAVDALRADATATMAAYRAAGQEVVAIAPLPVGAQASDVAVALDGYRSSIPEAVAVLEETPGALQAGRQEIDQVLTSLADAGQGLITYPSGLNAGQKAAEKADLPAMQIYRDIDGEGQDAAAIGRFLDQAAFRAGQEGAVLLVGHARPGTLAAIAAWAGGNRARTVALAPVSVVLKHQ